MSDDQEPEFSPVFFIAAAVLGLYCGIFVVIYGITILLYGS
jgi:hypothetical protein